MPNMNPFKLLFQLMPVGLKRTFDDTLLASRRRRQLQAEIQALADSARGKNLEEKLTILMESPFAPMQKRPEILGLLKELTNLKPSRGLEIGGARGGTLWLFTQALPTCKLLSIDLDYSLAKTTTFPKFSTNGTITCLSRDSHSRDTVKDVEAWLQGEMLDFLFIDGDHSLSGVRKDFELFSPLVRQGGLIVFHDIVPDEFHRTGVATTSDAGEVYQFWIELKKTHGRFIEFVENGEQDGYGIGILTWDCAKLAANL